MIINTKKWFVPKSYYYNDIVSDSWIIIQNTCKNILTNQRLNIMIINYFIVKTPIKTY